jgi:hypothetical protein
MAKAFAVALMVGVVLVVTAEAQAPSASASRSPVELVGCVSDDPGVSGAFTFSESTNGGNYRLTGKSVRRYAGRMVRLIGGPQGKRLSIRGGLWPSPNVAAQAGVIDSAQASIARQPGGIAAGSMGNLPEFRVTSVRTVEGSCR